MEQGELEEGKPYFNAMRKKENRERKVGQNIRKYRMALGLTQIDLAKKLGLTQALITNYERGLHTPPHRQTARYRQSPQRTLGGPLRHQRQRGAGGEERVRDEA